MINHRKCDLISSDLYRQMEQEENRQIDRYLDLGDQIAERIGYEAYCRWVDTQPDDISAKDFADASEAYLHQLEAEPDPFAGECAHGETREETEYGEPGALHFCRNCGAEVTE